MWCDVVCGVWCGVAWCGMVWRVWCVFGRGGAVWVGVVVWVGGVVWCVGGEGTVRVACEQLSGCAGAVCC